MPDGEIIINTELDNKEAQKELDRLIKKIQKSQQALAEKKDNQSGIAAELKSATDEAIKTEDTVARLMEELNGLKDITNGRAVASPGATIDAYQKQSQISDELKRQEDILKEQNKQAEKIGKKYAEITDKVLDEERALAAARDRAGELQKQIAEQEKAPEIIKATSDAVEKFSMRVKKLAKRVLVFTVIASALRKLKTWFTNVSKTNDQAQKAFAQLKAALLTLAQPLLNVLIPAFVAFVQILARVVAGLARLVSALFGTSAKASADAAKALNDETKAIKGVGSAAKKAGKSLAAFDEINQLSDSSSGGGVSLDPDFSIFDEADKRFDKIAKAVALIGAGLLAWKISDKLPGVLGTVMQKIAGIAIACGGLILIWDAVSDAFENGINWGNLGELLLGTTALVGGLALAFGKVGAGIGVVIAGGALLITAFNDIATNGTNLKNTLALLAGLVLTGLGFFILTGSVIPLVIAGILAVVAAVLALTGNLEEFAVNLKENILGGIIDFITGVFTGDWEKAWNGVKKIFKGIWNSIVIVVESAINIMIKGINWLISKLNTIHFDIPDWVPIIGGKSFGIHINPVAEVKLPRLATGAVIPPNREFLAVLGDQKSGTNIETPLATMIQAFKQALAEGGYSGANEAVLVCDKDVLGKVIYKLNKAEGSRIGVNLTGV
nr:MAG TPA: minor tail protein [Caudoviricetes sp.]